MTDSRGDGHWSLSVKFSSKSIEISRSILMRFVWFRENEKLRLRAYYSMPSPFSIWVCSSLPWTIFFLRSSLYFLIFSSVDFSSFVYISGSFRSSEIDFYLIFQTTHHKIDMKITRLKAQTQIRWVWTVEVCSSKI